MGSITKVYDCAALSAWCGLYKRGHCTTVHTFSDCQIPALAAFLRPDVLTNVRVANWIASHQVRQELAGICARHKDRQILLERIARFNHHFVAALVVGRRLHPLRRQYAVLVVEGRDASNLEAIRNLVRHIVLRAVAAYRELSLPSAHGPLTDAESSSHGIVSLECADYVLYSLLVVFGHLAVLVGRGWRLSCSGSVFPL
ncbi:hypothetical protein D3C85_1169960 [compost metagenome]